MASNKTVAALLIVAMVVSLFGMVLSLNRIEGIAKLSALTGAWDEAVGAGDSTYGAVNITISEQLRINFSDDTVNFGSGYVKGGYAGCIIATDGENDTGCTDWDVANGLILENTGNSAVTVNLTNTNYSSSFFETPDGGYAMKWEVPELSAVANTTCDQTVGDEGLGNNTVEFWGVYTNLTSDTYFQTEHVLCKSFNASDASDTINFSFKFVIPNNDRPADSLRDTFTATIGAAA